MRLPAPHRIARLYYVPRMLGFVLTFVVAGLLFFEGDIPGSQLAYAAVVCLLYPHVVYAWSCLARDKKRAALRGLVIDACVLGSLVAAIGFNLGLTFCLLTAVCLNNGIYDGLRGATRAVAAFVAGAVAAVVVVGLRFDPGGNATTTYLGLLVLFIYLMKIATIFHGQNALLVRATVEVDRRRRLFQGLAEAGLAMPGASRLEDLVDGWLHHLSATLPPDMAMAIVVRAPRRPRLVHQASFVAMDADEQSRLLSVVCETASSELVRRSVDGRQAPGGDGDDASDASDVGDVGIDHSAPRVPPGALAAYELLPIPVDAALLDALFVMRVGGPLSEAERGVMALFLQQLGAALSNYGLTHRLTQLANTDTLTGLANRASLDDRMGQVVARKRRQPGADFAVLMVDINGLKEANDLHGHDVGDRLIVSVAEALRSVCRDSDLVARMGGDEFVIVCHACTVAQAGPLLERLTDAVRDRIVDCRAVDGTAISLRVHLSVGVADSTETTPDAVMRLADQRMYEDKARYYRDNPREA